MFFRENVSRGFFFTVFFEEIEDVILVVDKNFFFIEILKEEWQIIRKVFLMCQKEEVNIFEIKYILGEIGRFFLKL